MVPLLGKKWAQRFVMHVWRAASGGASVVLTVPHTSQILRMDPRSASSGAPLAVIGLLFWPAAILSIGLCLRLRSAGASRLPTPTSSAMKRARPVRAVPASVARIPGTRRPKPGLR
ncbi:MAG TPA: hypothetical protein VGY99_27045 [Candidatus Binataceae bacterium]|jgi:hypothetical protein|nr:hypothetical protein [Candidatus Binataceae bacterium]